MQQSASCCHQLCNRPEVYIPIVRNVVARPFSNPKPGPAVPTWRHLSDDEVNTGKPFWWDEMYSRDAKSIDADVWSPLMNLTDGEEIFDIIKGISAGKSPGHDGITADLLRIAVGIRPGVSGGQVFRDSHCLQLLVSLVNAAIRTGACPALHKLRLSVSLDLLRVCVLLQINQLAPSLLVQRRLLEQQLAAIDCDLEQSRSAIPPSTAPMSAPGYSMKGPNAPHVYSTGYADDTVTVSSSWS